MNCLQINSLAAKYELGELNYFQIKRFESHIRKCSSCKKKYGTILLLGAVLYASSKTFTPSPFKLFISSLFFKTLFIIISTFTILSFSYFAFKQLEINNMQKINTINSSSNNKNYLNQNTNTSIIHNNSNSSDLKQINIISKEQGKEIQLKINMQKINIESRTEK
jgi:hypothetical protein